MTEEELFKRLKDSKGVPSLPQVLAEVISKDPALTARLLRFINSAFYGFREKISTIKHAVSLLGIREVRQ